MKKPLNLAGAAAVIAKVNCDLCYLTYEVMNKLQRESNVLRRNIQQFSNQAQKDNASVLRRVVNEMLSSRDSSSSALLSPTPADGHKRSRRQTMSRSDALSTVTSEGSSPIVRQGNQSLSPVRLMQRRSAVSMGTPMSRAGVKIGDLGISNSSTDSNTSTTRAVKATVKPDMKNATRTSILQWSSSKLPGAGPTPLPPQ